MKFMPQKKSKIAKIKLVILNIAVFIGFGIIALSLPIIKSNNINLDTNENLKLILECNYLGKVGDQYSDYSYTWDLNLKFGNSVVKTWDQIYAEYQRDHRILILPFVIKPSSAGLVYTGNYANLEKFQGLVVYLDLSADMSTLL